MYKLIDNENGYLKQDRVYKTLKEVHEDLKDFHSADCDTENWTLIDCLEIGNWTLTYEDGREVLLTLSEQ